MFSQIVQVALLQPLTSLLTFFASTSGNIGIGIILLTIAIRLVLTPFSLPAIRSQKKMTQLKPELDVLKKKFGKDAKSLQQAQMELYKKNGVNPLAGCLPYLVQFVVIIALYNVLQTFITTTHTGVSSWFLGIDMTVIDRTYVIPILAAVSQLVLSLMILPGIERHPETISSNGKKKEEKQDTQEMAAMMQSQMVFLMPITTGLFALGFPAGLGVYWIATTLFSIIQQWMVAGPGGLFTTFASLRRKIMREEK